MAEGQNNDRGLGLHRSKDQDGNIPLHVAARASNSDIIRTLLALDRTGLEEKNDAGQTALYLAVLAGNLEGTRTLLELGADPTTVANDGSSIWHANAMSGSIDMFVYLIKALGLAKTDADKENSTDPDSKRTSKDSPSPMDKKAAGSSKDSGTQGGASAGGSATEGGSEECKLKRKKTISISDYLDKIEGESDAVKAFIRFLVMWKETGEKEPLFHTLAQLDVSFMEAEVNLMRRQLSERPCDPSDVEEIDEGGYTLLHRAAISGSKDYVQKLLKHNVNINARSYHGQTAFMLASLSGCVEIMDMLVKAGIDYTIDDYMGSTALHFAANRKCSKAVRKLLALGFDPNKKNKKGDTPLHTASLMGGNFAVILALMEHGADFSIENSEGITPVCYFKYYNTFFFFTPEAVLREVFEGFSSNK